MDGLSDRYVSAEQGKELLASFAVADESATRLANAGVTELLPQVYNELRGMAANFMKNERPGHTLQPTALVHETYLRLLGQRTDLKNRAHLLAISARMMRRILVNYAVARRTEKRGADSPRVELDHALEVFDKRDVSAIEVNRALDDLEALDPRQAHIAELRFFGGLSVEETGDALGISPATVKREWSVAKLWLRQEMVGAN